MTLVETNQWLLDTRCFWDVDSESEARYRRICSSPEIDATEDPQALEQIWQRETESSMALILDGIPIEKDWCCLEIGCGMGRLLKPMSARCSRVIGVDVSEKMIGFAQKYMAGVGNAELHLNTGRSLEAVADNSVDFVYSHLAFQHITLYDVVDDYLAEISRVLKPGGYCRIQTWREGPLPLIEDLKNVIRPLIGSERQRSNRCWQWRAGKRVQFGGVTFRPGEWRRRLRQFGLKTTKVQLGLGHDYWMWTTSRTRGSRK